MPSRRGHTVKLGEKVEHRVGDPHALGRQYHLPASEEDCDAIIFAKNSRTLKSVNPFLELSFRYFSSGVRRTLVNRHFPRSGRNIDDPLQLLLDEIDAQSRIEPPMSHTPNRDQLPPGFSAAG
jgi:hypothetical protein